jgi:amino acid transporter
MLSTKEWAPIVSWITGWLTLVGNWTVTLSINFSGAQLILSAITLWDDTFVANAWQTVLMFWGIMTIAFLVNVFGAKYLDLINKVCIYWTGGSVIIIVVTILVISDDRRNAEFVFVCSRPLVAWYILRGAQIWGRVYGPTNLSLAHQLHRKPLAF